MTDPAEAPSSRSASPPAEPLVLLVEDDRAVAEVVGDALVARGYEVQRVATGHDALAAATSGPRAPDVVVLDLGLPDLDGLEVCRRLRTWTTNPIIVLSADGAESRKVAALDEGADDYVTKPFSMNELLARMRVAERHRAVLAQVVDDVVVRVGDVVIDTGARTVTVAGDEVSVTRKEFDLLVLLARNVGRVLTHGLLLSSVWGRDGGGTASLRVHVVQLRRKLGEGPSRPQLVSDPGTGYRLVLSET